MYRYQGIDGIHQVQCKTAFEQTGDCRKDEHSATH